MSNENPTPQLNEQGPKNGWSTKKKWVVGCSGCLGMVLLLAIGLAVLAGMGVNSVMNVSNQGVATIFGPSYKPNNYMAMGLPINNRSVKAMALLIGQDKGSLLFAFQTSLPEKQIRILQSGKVQLMQPLLNRMADEAVASAQSSGSSAEKINALQLTRIYNLNLSPDKVYIVCNATIEVEKKGVTYYAPMAITLLPEPAGQLAILAMMNTKDSSSSEDTNFAPVHEEMQKQLLQLITDSELDDRLSTTEAAKAKSAQPH
jgi:hypothetical protein